MSLVRFSLSFSLGHCHGPVRATHRWDCGEAGSGGKAGSGGECRVYVREGSKASSVTTGDAKRGANDHNRSGNGQN
jgi:hypothetical protein